MRSVKSVRNALRTPVHSTWPPLLSLSGHRPSQLPLKFVFEALLSLCVPGCPDAFVVLDLLRDDRVENDGQLVCRCRNPGGWAELLAFMRRRKSPRTLRL